MDYVLLYIQINATAALVYIQINATAVTEWFAPLLSNTVGPRLAN